MKRFFAVAAGMLMLMGIAACGNSTKTTPDAISHVDAIGPVCGNGTCERGETHANCSTDCKGTCGNGTCDAGETVTSCPADCESSGDIIINHDTNGTDVINTNDNDAIKHVCGDGTCDTANGETHINCPTDCKGGDIINETTVPVCGDGKCETGETSVTCPADCTGGDIIETTGPVCGNGKCETGETSVTCPTDCSGDIIVDETTGHVCGDGVCDTANGETAANCSADCSPTKKNCAEYATCYSDCQSQKDIPSCTTACQNASTSDAVSNFGDYLTCAQKNCAGITDNTKYSKCIDDNCLDQYFKCFSGNTFLKCTDLDACLNKCPNDTSDKAKKCVQACFTGAAYQANIDWDAMVKCINGQCTTKCDKTASNYDKKVCNTCINDALYSTACVDKTAKCFAHGTDTCGQIMNCLGACAKGDKKCVQACIAKGTFDAQNQFSGWQQCGLDACPTDCADQSSAACNTCWSKAVGTGGSCYSKVQACINDLPSGNQPCKTSWTCLMGAASTSDANQCKYNATKSAQAQMNKILDCARTTCKDSCSSNPNSKACTDCFAGALDPTKTGAACKTEVDTCNADS